MKKHILFILSVVLLAACTKDFEEQNIVDPKVFNVVLEDSYDTKVHLNESLKSRWDEGDLVAVFAGTTSKQKYEFKGSTGDSDSNGKLVGEGTGSGSSLSANYAVYPYNNVRSIRQSSSVLLDIFFPSTQYYEAGSYGKAANTMVAVTSSTEDNNFLFKNLCGYLKVSLYGSATITSIELKGNNSEVISGQGIARPVFSDYPRASLGTGKTYITLNCGNGVALGSSASSATDFYFVVPPVTFTNGFTITATLSDGSTFEKSTDKSIKITRNKIQKMAAVLVETESETVDELVDLGLSVKWRSWNLGATKPEEYGDYYAWGATEPWYKDGYSQETPGTHWKSGKTGGYTLNNAPYQTANTTDYLSTTWTKYLVSVSSSFKDASATNADAVKIILDFEDDAARDALGDNWRMPTDAEWDELANTDNCSWTWTTYQGVVGYKVQSKKSGYTDKWIFLPAAGHRVLDELCTVGIDGFYSSSRVASPDIPLYCHSVYFRSNYINKDDNEFRYYGLSVRPVYSDDPKSGVTGISLNKTSLTLDVDAMDYLSATVSKKSGAVNDQVEWSSSDPSVVDVMSGLLGTHAPGTATITAKTVFGGFTATCTVTVLTPDPDAVDLGLSVKWAKYNLGATKPEEYGDYYAWAATEPWYEAGYAQEVPQTHWKEGKSGGYCWNNTPYQTADVRSNNNFGDTRFTKYVGSKTSSYKDASATDEDALKKVLDPEDDAASVVLGNGWRMATFDEWSELWDNSNCTWTWTTLNGVNGYKVQSKKSGYTDNWIFLPATGRWNSDLSSVGTEGLYWCSSLGDSYSAYFFSFTSSTRYKGNHVMRRCGLSVRAVKD